ncbi:MAG: histidinol-phosphate transaminase [Chitinophagales bacterium]
MQSYASARAEFSGNAKVFLDANENPFESKYNRYPDPWHQELKEKLAAYKNIATEYIFLGNGSDEAIDLLIRAFCNPGLDKIVLCTPTYGMYKVTAALNDIEVQNIPLLENFQPDTESIQKIKDVSFKLLFLCSPNNPSGNCLSTESISKIIDSFPGIVVLDEAYIDFADQRSFINRLDKCQNLVVLQTLSKAWGMAGIRIGMAFANPQIIAVLNKIKAPYNISTPNMEAALNVLANTQPMKKQISEIVEQRNHLSAILLGFNEVERVYPSDANFLLVKFKDAKYVFQTLCERGIVLRDRSKQVNCEHCLRITIGTPKENEILVNTLSEFLK